jgi:hypothetical protein
VPFVAFESNRSNSLFERYHTNASTLCGRVGASGHVTAIDIDTRFVRGSLRLGSTSPLARGLADRRREA